ncbi:MAG: TerB family tellurite resistance protein [Rhodospirillaceae bacterium]|nr:TerB family tellurite resistance protein [Rhodospirillaceae bacterium]
MLHHLKAFLQDLTAEPPLHAPHGPEQLRLAAAALLAEAARVDGRVDPEERRAVVRLLRERFGLGEDEAAELAALAEQRAAQSVQYFGFVDVINRHFTPDERIGLIEMLWEVVHADGRPDALQASLMRRLAGLLHVSDPDSGAARKRALARLQAG